ncbi:MAG: ATP-binding protein [Ignavibacteria bacterium]
MLSKITYNAEGNRKYFTLFLLLLFMITGLGILSPILVEKKSSNWEKELKTECREIETSVKFLIDEKTKGFLKDKEAFSTEITPLLRTAKLPAGSLIDIVNSSKYKSYSIEIFNDREELVAWTPYEAVPGEAVFPLENAPGEFYFRQTGLITYLSITDTVKFNNRIFYYTFSIPVEKKYKIQNEYYKSISLSGELSQKYQTYFETDYSSLALESKDGRKYSFAITSNNGNRIAVVTFTKPSRENSLTSFEDLFINIQSIIAVTALIILGFVFYPKYKKIRFATLKILAFTVYLALFRFVLFILSLPSKFFEGQITDPSCFASSFGFGIVKSPLEFFITISLFLVVCINIFNKAYRFPDKNGGDNIIGFILKSVAGTAVLLVILRGLGASLRSIIFDSSLRYFKEPGLLPNIPAALMQLNFLLLGLSSVLVSVVIILLILKAVKNKRNIFIKYFLWLFVFAQTSGVFYDLIQSEPQGTPLIRILFITFVFLLSYKILREEKKTLFNFVYFALVSSIITISLLNYYNTRLEKESLKTTALELTRANDTWFEFLIRDALSNVSQNPETFKALKDQRTNYETAAFAIWSQSSLQREEISSAVTFLDKQKAFLGSFGININPKYRISPATLKYNGENIEIFDNYQPSALKGKIITGIIPVKEDKLLLGYVVASILYDAGKFRVSNFPAFLESKVNSFNSAVSFEKLNVFVFNSGLLSCVFGDLTPSDRHIKRILNAKLSENNDGWIDLKISNENYITYIFKHSENKTDRIIAAALKEKNLSWSLYNFFKVFFIHSIFIISFLIIVFTLQIKESKGIKYTFRSQLLFAFLFTSVLPMFFLAFYNRSLTEEKNNDIIIYKLKQNLYDTENYLKEHFADNPTRDLKLLCGDAARDLNIEFSLFAEKKLYFSSKDEFYRAGIISRVINPLVYNKLRYQGYKEFIVNESVENYLFSSFYGRVVVNNKEYILTVSNLFNKIPPPVTGEEVDIFLFGSYFFAAILVIILSTVLANRISSPIRSLIKATASVAGGDLSFEVNNNQKGEIRELVSGFNSMIKELKRGQSELAELEREIAWKEMARQVAHEIKNPLTPMKLAVQQLIIAYKDKSPKLDEIFGKVTKTIISQIETLNNIASEFSAFARMPSLKVEKIDIADVIHDARNLFIEDNIIIKIDREHSPVFVNADKDQLKRAIINLLRNAIQAEASEVSIQIFAEGGKINVEISDNGTGIPEKYINKIFDPDFTTKAKGMGIGLKLARKFMESIKGRIYVYETSVSGTKIILEFPADEEKT